MQNTIFCHIYWALNRDPRVTISSVWVQVGMDVGLVSLHFLAISISIFFTLVIILFIAKVGIVSQSYAVIATIIYCLSTCIDPTSF